MFYRMYASGGIDRVKTGCRALLCCLGVVSATSGPAADVADALLDTVSTTAVVAPLLQPGGNPDGSKSQTGKVAPNRCVIFWLPCMNSEHKF